jgi:hypothetical protein
MKNHPSLPSPAAPLRQVILPSVAGFILGLTGAGVQALELGRPQTLSALGQPLLLKIPVQLDPGETLRPDCSQVTVQAGERDVAASRVASTVEWQADQSAATIWVRTADLIDEPIVKLSLGCPRQQLIALVDQDAAVGRAETKPLSALPQAASAARPPAWVKAAATERVQSVVKPEKPGAAEKTARADRVQITLPDAELAGLRWRFDLETGRSAGSQRPALASLKEAAHKPPSVSLLMAIDVNQPTASAAPVALDIERLQRAQLQFATLQRQQQAFSTEIDQLLADSAQQEIEQSTLRRGALGIAAALLLLIVGWLLRARLTGRRSAVPPA